MIWFSPSDSLKDATIIVKVEKIFLWDIAAVWCVKATLICLEGRQVYSSLKWGGDSTCLAVLDQNTSMQDVHWACRVLNVTCRQSERGDGNKEGNSKYRRKNNSPLHTGKSGEFRRRLFLVFFFSLLKIAHKPSPLLRPPQPCLFTLKTCLMLRGFVSFPIWHLNVREWNPFICGVSYLPCACISHTVPPNLLYLWLFFYHVGVFQVLKIHWQF